MKKPSISKIISNTFFKSCAKFLSLLKKKSINLYQSQFNELSEQADETELDKLLFPSNSTNVTFRSSRKQITNTAGNSTTATTQQQAQT